MTRRLGRESGADYVLAGSRRRVPFANAPKPIPARRQPPAWEVLRYRGRPRKGRREPRQGPFAGLLGRRQADAKKPRGLEERPRQHQDSLLNQQMREGLVIRDGG